MIVRDEDTTDSYWHIESWVDQETRVVWYRVVHTTTGQVYADNIGSWDRARRAKAQIESDIG